MSYAFHLNTSKPDWRDPDLSVLDSRRSPVPSAPLALLPQPWRDWIAETEKATGAPADYVVQSVLAGVAAVCGAGVRVRVTPAWDEPLILWQAVVGEPSTGKSAALAPMRRLLDLVEQERRAGDEERRAAQTRQGGGKDGDAAPFVPSQVVASDADPVALVDIVSGNPRGVLLWRDGPAVWIGAADDDEDDSHRTTWLAAWDSGAVTVARPRQPARSLPRFAVSILETIRPERLQESLRSGDDSLAARFLFAWPGPQPYRALAVVEGARDEEILHRLRALSRLAGSADDPCVLAVDDRGRAALDKVLAALHAERQNVEGLEAAWIGKSRSLIVRLAGVLELLATIDGKAKRPGAIGAEQVEAVAALWRDYYWPHAKAVFDSAELSDNSKRVLRVARWLVAKRPADVSREEIRRRALGQAATAEETESVLQRLHYLGYVQPDLAHRDKPGRPANRWLVNPALAAPENP
ncbi:DUF3987 domain-containing protein [Reyranella soli]|uniref:DUF3987 domain-containing protein n=1 Tax=Reyranella soli TaxID=1230389 RepID=A0A512N4P4_9HYPH|nr:DUF3987 domain-containing protein [Reyranella soli]GEP53957.1 hypothetical protein RSO01_11230 [Reyranella soli]